MNNKIVTADEREKLYIEIWEEPLSVVAKRHNISSDALRNQCKKLNIPLPPREYWGKGMSKQTIRRPALPKVTGELKKRVCNYAIKYKADIKEFTDEELMVDEELSLLSVETKKLIADTCSQIQVKNQLRNPHNLIIEHKEEIINRRKRDKALNQKGASSIYYPSEKNSYRNNKAILPLYVSDLNINRAYRILDTLINTIDDMEGDTFVSKDSGKDTAYFTVLRTFFYFEIKEKVKKGRTSNESNESHTILELVLTANHWCRGDLSKKIEYKDNASQPLEAQLGKIVYDMFVIANRFMATDELDDRERDRNRAEKERQGRLEQMRKGELEEVKLLEQAASDWDKAQKIRRFADCMELQIVEVTDPDKREKLLKWLKWARNKADWLDPLTEKEDDLLGKSKHIFELIDNATF